eukprot:gb/GEZN01016821.1/.p1 GENE.gb/GEZN01016821.1/~~gb/GEZN01016821.1/.p1  ORF type:complete len:252 (+),score=37.83 gb/GEZN01016821.1/:34-756(+)
MSWRLWNMPHFIAPGDMGMGAVSTGEEWWASYLMYPNDWSSGLYRKANVILQSNMITNRTPTPSTRRMALLSLLCLVLFNSCEHLLAPLSSPPLPSSHSPLPSSPLQATRPPLVQHQWEEDQAGRGEQVPKDESLNQARDATFNNPNLSGEDHDQAHPSSSGERDQAHPDTQQGENNRGHSQDNYTGLGMGRRGRKTSKRTGGSRAGVGQQEEINPLMGIIALFLMIVFIIMLVSLVTTL